ncbi:MAG: RimK/LysX family protein [Pirellulales bacterium]|nr:RimK/LysX family protein [Pirellulales bacterium]
MQILAVGNNRAGKALRKAAPAAASLCLVATLAILGEGLRPGTAGAKVQPQKPAAGDVVDGKRLIGATAVVVEAETGIPFLARVDTGAHSTSLHVEKWEIEGESKDRKKNIGKKIRFQLHNGKKHAAWVTGKIVSTVRVKTSVDHESRYKVEVRLRVGDFEKECLVTLNDRSHMTYPALLGRNFLYNDFLVDVSLDEALEHDAAVTVDGEEVETHDETEDHEEAAEG